MTAEEHAAEAERLLEELEPKVDANGIIRGYIVGHAEYGNRALKAHTHALLALFRSSE